MGKAPIPGAAGGRAAAHTDGGHQLVRRAARPAAGARAPLGETIAFERHAPSVALVCLTYISSLTVTF